MKTKLMLLVVFVGIVTAAVFSTRMVLAQGEPRRIEITAKRFTYEPGEITLKKGQPVVLVIKSLDVTHGLRFREFNLNTKIEKGTPAELSFTPDKTGDFVGHCSNFCGTLWSSDAPPDHIVRCGHLDGADRLQGQPSQQA